MRYSLNLWILDGFTRISSDYGFQLISKNFNTDFHGFLTDFQFFRFSQIFTNFEGFPPIFTGYLVCVWGGGEGTSNNNKSQYFMKDNHISEQITFHNILRQVTTFYNILEQIMTFIISSNKAQHLWYSTTNHYISQHFTNHAINDILRQIKT